MEYKKALSCIFVIGTIFATVVDAKKGFILTAPKVLKTGTIEHLSLTLYKVKEGGHVTIQLLKEHSDDVIAETSVFAKSDHNMWVELFVPNVLYKKAKLRIYGAFDNGYKIDEKKEVHLEQKSLLTFIQTDKPVYKPGQTVSFRIFPVDIKLEPVERNTVGDVWIENPSGIRVEQWKNVSFATGLIQLSLSLSGEATLGDWTIYSEILGKTEEQTFEVAKYVLPRFEVTATPPPYVLANASTVTWEICARYTYGKRVNGILRGNVTYDFYQWEKTSKTFRPLPFVDFEKPISGCADVEINTLDLVFERRLYSRGLVINAEVVENDTDALQNVTSKVAVHTEPFNIKILTEQGSNFKPGIPYRGKVKVTTPDDIPVTQELVSVCIRCNGQEFITRACKHFTSDEDGYVYFTIPPQNDSVTLITIKAEAVHFPTKKHGKLVRPFASIRLPKWFSKSQSYIQIEPPIRKFLCEEQEEVKVIYTPIATSRATKRIKFYHQIISRGQIVKQGAHWRTFDAAEDKGKWSYDTYIRDNQTIFHVANGEFVLKFDSRLFMSPIARLLVFYVHPSHEIIADSQAFMLNTCLPNKVNFSFDQRQQYPGSEASINVKAYPNSLCGLTVVDKSVHLMKSGSKFTLDKIFDVLKKYDLNENTFSYSFDDDYCREARLLEFKNRMKTFNDFDLRRRRRSFMYTSTGVDAMMAFEGAGVVVLSDLTLKTRPCHFGEPAYHTISMMSARDRTVPGMERSDPISMFAPPRFAASDNSNPTPSIDETIPTLRSYFPETWLWELQDIGENGEINLKRKLPDTITEWMGNAVCISHQSGLGVSDTASIVTFKPFFVSIILPYSVVRGEKVPVIVKVFNYLSDCLPIFLILEPSKDFEVINNINTHKFCVCGSESMTHRFMIQPNVLGNITLKVNGYPLEDTKICNDQYTTLMSATDGASRNLLVVAEGFYQEDTKTTYFCPKDYNEETFTESIAINFSNNLVKGSELAYFSVTGDIMGPSLNGLQKLVRLPVGCGEQNMVLFAPNIFVMDYLTATNRVTDDVKSTILDYMKTGYQRELNYRHEDGSYSAFGMSDSSGSMWLTAFVVKSFSQARRYIDIDEDDLKLSVKWIVKHQLENGCFPTVGELHNKAMKGGIAENEHTYTTLTAYTIITLLENGMNKLSKVIKSATFCIYNEPNPTSYSLALFAYASALAEDPSAKRYLKDLKAKAIYNDGMMYWDSEHKSRSISIETGAYAILAYLQLGGSENIVQALSIIRWIIKSRNSNGGFVSTQDTVIALQALAEYATRTSQTNVDMTVIAEGDNFEENFHLSETNKLVMQSVKVPSLPTVLHVTASGDGCALIQVSKHYHLKNMPKNAAFHLRIRTFRTGISNCDMSNIRICARYKINGKTSNMAIIETKMISGYIPDEFSLNLLREIEELALKRYEVTSNNVVFYFDKLSNEEKCFHFTVIRDFEVENAMPAIVKLYDYYEQESFMAVNYTIQPECSEEMPFIDTLTNDTLELASDEIQQLDIEFVNTSVIFNNPDFETDLERQESSRTDRPQNNENAFDEFVNVDHELEFPDGLEGNVPVTVTPPPQMPYRRQPVPPRPIPSVTEELAQPISNGSVPANLHAFTSELCPLCYTTLPPDFFDVYCNSAFALKIELRNVLTGRMKIIYDFSPQLNHVQKINAFADYSIHSICSCLSSVNKDLQNGRKFFIIGKMASLWQSEPKQHVVLNSDVFVVSVTESMSRRYHLKEAQEKCTNV